MLKDIFIKGFESYKNKTHLRLHKNVNIIIGVSDSGKSAIVRSEKLLNQNSPQGEAYKNDDLGKKDKVEIINTYDDKQKITIIRKNGKTAYKINNEKEPLKALKGKIPTEIQEITRMKSINIQGQHPKEQYFLLTESPGQVAKKFNEVAGISIMDKALSKTSSLKRETNAELKIIAKEIIKTEKFIQENKWVTKAMESAKSLKEIEEKTAAFRAQRLKIFGFVGKITFHDNKIKRDYHSISEALKALKKLKLIENEINEIKVKKESLKNVISTIKELDLQISHTKDTDNILNELNKLIKLQNDLTEKHTFYNRLQNLVTSIEKNNSRIKKGTIIIKNTERDFAKQLKIEECPICGRKG